MPTQQCLDNIANEQAPHNIPCSSSWCRQVQRAIDNHCGQKKFLAHTPVITYEEPENRICYCCCSCFGYETPIEASPGQFVMAGDIDNGETILAADVRPNGSLDWKPKRVQNASGFEPSSETPLSLYELFFKYDERGGSTIRSFYLMPDNLLLLNSGKLKAIQHLKPGDKLRRADGGEAEVHYVRYEKLFHPLLKLIASATDRELAQYVEYLKEENKILRARIPGQIHTKPGERKRLMELGKPLGRAIEELITIVPPKTFYRWCRDTSGQAKPKNPKGGQRKPKELRELVIEIAKATGFGYTRIIGELRKLGINRISRQTVRNILKEEGIEPGPDRTSDKWETFLARHAETLWGCDFFSVRTVTARGIREMYLMVYLCLETREVIMSSATEHPNSAWVCKQAEFFLEQTMNRDVKPSIVMHDRDSKFTKDFVKTLKNRDVRTNALPKASPNLNGRCERFVKTIREECLSKFIFFGRKHLDFVVSEFLEYYNKTRSHSEREFLPPIRTVPDEVSSVKLADIEVKSDVGGLVKPFARKAA